jgi:hypothetical protein
LGLPVKWRFGEPVTFFKRLDQPCVLAHGMTGVFELADVKGFVKEDIEGKASAQGGHAAVGAGDFFAKEVWGGVAHTNQQMGQLFMEHGAQLSQRGNIARWRADCGAAIAIAAVQSGIYLSFCAQHFTNYIAKDEQVTGQPVGAVATGGRNTRFIVGQIVNVAMDQVGLQLDLVDQLFGG